VLKLSRLHCGLLRVCASALRPPEAAGVDLLGSS
jgi:hypothetical protein